MKIYEITTELWDHIDPPLYATLELAKAAAERMNNQRTQGYTTPHSKHCRWVMNEQVFYFENPVVATYMCGDGVSYYITEMNVIDTAENNEIPDTQSHHMAANSDVSSG